MTENTTIDTVYKYNFVVKAIVVISIFIAFFLIQARGQNISGKVADQITGESISNCNIKIQGTITGTTSCNDGKFGISAGKFPVTIFVSHVGYHNQYIKIEKPVPDLNIVMERKTYLIDSVDVHSEKIVNIVENKPLYIWDYEFFEDKILVLAFLDNSMFKPRLILLNDLGDTLCVKPVKKARKLYKDCLDNVHLICTDEVHQIYYDSENLHLLYTYPIEVLDSVLNPCVEYMDGNYYVSKYYYDDQILQYYFVDNQSMEYNVLTTISDSLGLVHLFDEERFSSMASYNEFDQRFAKLFFFNPVFAPLVRVDSLICIFNYANNVIEKYDSKGHCTEIINIAYHKDKNWKEYLLVDDIMGKAYTIFRKNGILSIHEINLKSGEIDDGVTLTGYVYIDKFKVNNGSLYFLYKDDKLVEYKKLFRMKL